LKNLLILGAGGFGKTVADLAEQLGCYGSIRFLDDSPGENILGQCSRYADFLEEGTEVYPAFGNNVFRKQWINRLQCEGIPVPTLIHPRAYVSPRATLGQGTVVLPMAVVNTGVRVGEGCIINIGALIDHDSVIENYVHLAPGTIVKAENRIPAETKIESGTVIENRQYPL